MVAPVQDGRVDELPDRVRRRLDEVFGDVLPTTTGDERDDDPRQQSTPDEDLLADRPPHHDRD